MTRSRTEPGNLLDRFSMFDVQKTVIVVPACTVQVSDDDLRAQVEVVPSRLCGGRHRLWRSRFGIARPNGLPTVARFLTAAMDRNAAPLSAGNKLLGQRKCTMSCGSRRRLHDESAQ